MAEQQQQTEQGQPPPEGGQQQPAEGGQHDQASEGGGGGDGTGQPPQKLSAVELADRGKQHLQEMTGHTPETVSGLERQGDGWRLTLEVVEMSRIPPSTDVLGTYELDLTGDGELTGYRRSSRYYRNQAQGSG